MSEMNEVYKVHYPRRHFTVREFPNYIIYEKKDGRLSFGAIMILLYIKGQSTKWIARRSDIMTQLDISKNTFSKYMRELINAGYVSLKRGRNEKTGEYYTSYTFYFDPAENEDYDGKLPLHYFDHQKYIEEKVEKKKASSVGGQKKAKKAKKAKTSNNNITSKSENTREKEKNSDDDWIIEE